MTLDDERETLQQLVDELSRPEHWEFTIERRADAWWAVSEGRYFNDDGEYLGPTVALARRAIRDLLG
jgi:hypothetical protein